MQILPLLLKPLKDDAILEILDWSDAEVIYDFDRSHENIPDVYWAHLKARGICLRFDENQILDTIYLYAQGIEGYTALDKTEIDDITFWPNHSDVRVYATKNNLAHQTGERPASLPPKGQWIRIEQPLYSLHYEFREEELTLVTIMSKS
jgi:hypothetical protein